MRARFGAFEVVCAAPADDVLLVVDVTFEHFLEVERAGLAVDQREHDRAEGILQLRVLVEVVENDGGVNVLLQLDHDAHALTVALIADIGDALNALFTHEFGDFLD